MTTLVGQGELPRTVSSRDETPCGRPRASISHLIVLVVAIMAVCTAGCSSSRTARTATSPTTAWPPWSVPPIGTVIVEGPVPVRILSYAGPLGPSLHSYVGLDTSLIHLRDTLPEDAVTTIGQRCSTMCWPGVDESPGQLYLAVQVASLSCPVRRIVTALAPGAVHVTLIYADCPAPSPGAATGALPPVALFAAPLSHLPHGQKVTVSVDEGDDTSGLYARSGSITLG
jgi:hypothetical protein